MSKRDPAKRKESLQSVANDEDSLFSDDLIIDEPSTKNTRPNPSTIVKLSEETLSLCCKWKDCQFYSDKFEKFTYHLIWHIDSNNENKGLKNCLFGDCNRKFLSYETAKQHLSFHAYHEKLMNLGKNLAIRENLPECNQSYSFVFPQEVNGYECEWDDCSETFLSYPDFLMHLKMHVNGNPRSSKNGQRIDCGWKYCTLTFPRQRSLSEHVRIHTKEKLIACHVCGNLFASRTRLSDHRKRQLPIEKQTNQCSQCSKLFPTEKLLRDHMRVHINQHKCSMCDMTCSKPSSLAIHIRYRHLNERPFKCNLCDHASITKQNLEMHLITHCAEKLMACDECDFRCRSMHGLDRHCQSTHGHSYSQTYECHVCNKKFLRGAMLTKHLMKVHKYLWPSGHSRFRYKEDPDGIFRLQTLRYESLEVIEDILKSKANPPKKKKGPLKYSLKKRSGDNRVPTFDLDVLENESQNEPKVEQNPEQSPPNKSILITISDIDDQGNVIKSEVIESQEVS